MEDQKGRRSMLQQKLIRIYEYKSIGLVPTFSIIMQTRMDQTDLRKRGPLTTEVRAT